MRTAVCTLFEGHYHHGLGALVNSLCLHRFKGVIWAGYRGDLPPWAHPTKNCGRWCEFAVAGDCAIRFVELKTEWHFTNYKPRFMLELWNDYCPEMEALIYFDPDIVIKCRWDFYETWVTHGVALVHEIVSNDMPPSHPLRMEWGKVIVDCQRRITHQLHSYINGGFCGVARPHMDFLKVWVEVIDFAVKNHRPDPTRFMSLDRTHSFFSIDQDALNIAAMCCDAPLSTMGPEGMDFVHGGWTMSHAVGTPKPWRKKFFRSALQGRPPTQADRQFWLNAESPIRLFGPIHLGLSRFGLAVAAFIGRFYRRH